MAPDTTEARIHLEAHCKEAMETIRSRATEQYNYELDLERKRRQWRAGFLMTPVWTQYFRQEQQNVVNGFKQSNQTDDSVRTSSESATEERRSAVLKPNNKPPALAPTTTLPPVPPSPSVRPAEEHEKHSVSPQSVRRGSDVRGSVSGNHDDSGSFRRNHNAPVHVRPGLPRNWVSPDNVDEPEAILRSPPTKARRVPSIDRPSQPSRDIRWESSLGRSSGSIHSAEPRLPPSAAPEVWKPTISPAEGVPPPAKPYNLGRRGSATKMRSTGSGESIRPSITEETIPEGADDDGPDGSNMEEETIRKKMKKREDILHQREHQLMLREADRFRREEEAKKKQEEKARRREESKERVRKDEQETWRREEEAIWEKGRQEAGTFEKEMWRREAARLKFEREEAGKKAAEAKREEDNMKRKLEAEEKRKAAKRREEDSRRRAEARLKKFHREQEETRLQNGYQHPPALSSSIKPTATSMAHRVQTPAALVSPKPRWLYQPVKIMRFTSELKKDGSRLYLRKGKATITSRVN